MSFAMQLSSLLNACRQSFDNSEKHSWLAGLKLLVTAHLPQGIVDAAADMRHQVQLRW